MLFNSFVFLFGFLPVVLAVTFLVARWRPVAIAWLLLASLVFYGYWNPALLTVLLASVAFNFAIATRMQSSVASARMWWLAAGVSGNLAALAWFKYRHFFAVNFDALLGTATAAAPGTLPLGISFFTFTQIAFLVDLHRREASLPGLPRYGLFVTFFPHLIAGPLYHHAQVMPQFDAPAAFRASRANLLAGLDLLVVGLFKKCVIADHLAPLADAAFNRAAVGYSPDMAVAWIGIIAYGFQIYFDFSGYSDMAMGLARMLGVRLPVNFDAPYRATSIVEFWRRWHMTLSAFLRDYLYIPLGGNRHGTARRYANLLITMILGGLWHGAAWTFILWGAVHGALLCVNHLWNRWFPGGEAGSMRRLAGVVLTFTAVMLAWVLFRASNVAAAMLMYRGALGATGKLGEIPTLAPWYLGAAAIVVFALPVSWRTVEREHFGAAPAPGRLAFGAAVGAMLFAVLDAMVRTQPAPFLYFNF